MVSGCNSLNWACPLSPRAECNQEGSLEMDKGQMGSEVTQPQEHRAQTKNGEGGVGPWGPWWSSSRTGAQWGH